VWSVYPRNRTRPRQSVELVYENNLLKKGADVRATRTAFLGVLPLVIVFMVCGCASPPTAQELAQRLDNPGSTLRITVNSMPPGATVYGEAGGALGRPLGTTPLTLRYMGDYRGIYGDCPDETLDSEMKSDTPFSAGRVFVAFKCWVMKEGYAPYRLYCVLDDRHPYPGPFGAPNYWQVFFGTQKVLTVPLVPVGPAAPLVPGSKY